MKLSEVKRTEDGWIIDVLPEELEDYKSRKQIACLISTDNGSVVLKRSRIKNSDHWYWSDHGLNNVIAWMPVLKPYKGESKLGG